LGRGLAALAEDLGPQAWANTTVIVLSEFSRTFKENGDKGTDHGHGTVYWVLGGSVKGGRIAGDQIKLTASLNENRDLPVRTDYRALIASLIESRFQLSPAQVSAIFPGAPIDRMEIGRIRRIDLRTRTDGGVLALRPHVYFHIPLRHVDAQA